MYHGILEGSNAKKKDPKHSLQVSLTFVRVIPLTIVTNHKRTIINIFKCLWVVFFLNFNKFELFNMLSTETPRSLMAARIMQQGMLLI